MLQEPVRPTPHETPPTRPGGRRLGLLGLIVIGCLALAVPVIGAVTASSNARALAAGASAVPAASDKPGHGNGNGKVHGSKADKGLKGIGGPGRNGHGPITIGAIAGSQVSLRTEDGWTRTIAITPTTTITKAGQPIGVADLKVGDAIRFHQIRNADGTFTVDAVVVPTPRAGGEVTAVDANSITVRSHGATRVITVDGKTVYKLGSAAATKADVKVGSEVEAQGSLSGDTFLAATLAIEPPHRTGLVTAKTSTTITIKRGDGSMATIHVTDKTTYRVKGKDAATIADIAVGDRVTASGTLRADGSLDAVAVGTKGAEGHGTDDQDDDEDAPASASPG